MWLWVFNKPVLRDYYLDKIQLRSFETMSYLATYYFPAKTQKNGGGRGWNGQISEHALAKLRTNPRPVSRKWKILTWKEIKKQVCNNYVKIGLINFNWRIIFKRDSIWILQHHRKTIFCLIYPRVIAILFQIIFNFTTNEPTVKTLNFNIPPISCLYMTK